MGANVAMVEGMSYRSDKAGNCTVFAVPGFCKATTAVGCNKTAVNWDEVEECTCMTVVL